MPFFTTRGHRLFYREQGAGRLLLILPGNTASSACHGGELEYFGARRRAVALDLWGSGQSDRLPVWPADWWEQGARDAAKLVDRLGCSDAIVMGTSGGAIAALLMAGLYPERVRAVIADSAVSRLAAPALSREVENRRRRTPDSKGACAKWWEHNG